MSNILRLNRRHFLKGAGMTAVAGAVGAGVSSTAAAADGMPYQVDGKYDFETPYDRLGTHCVKWDSQVELYGDKVEIGMGIADMDFRSAPCIQEAMAERLQHENWGYLNGTGYNHLKEGIVKWNAERHGVEVDPDSLVIATGVHPGLIATLKTFSAPASKVLMMTPTYNGFYSDLRASQTIKNESEMVFEDGKYSIDWDDFEARMTADTASLLLCNPQNPTGNVWSEEDLLRIGELCLKHQVVVLADEIHADFVRAGQKYTPFASLPDKDIVNNSLTFKAITKTFSMPASKNAYWYSTNPVYLERVKKNHRAGINTLGVVANAAAYHHGADWLDQLLPYIDANHSFVENYLKENLPEVGYTKAEGTFLSWLHFDDIMEECGAVAVSEASQDTDNPISVCRAFRDWLVENSGVQLNDGITYGKGGERCMRMNIGTSRVTLRKALDNMAEAIRSI
ncbi:MAG: aminotransferase class I/II-fold pyridoxal phosphate-dependent enzyme [Gammaproteobacteria bacterium]|nr:aminotransferase class I/II-fold pyridoxal phosphate-dependent enzyme [Gammaproteobacteria bacterium]